MRRNLLTYLAVAVLAAAFVPAANAGGSNSRQGNGGITYNHQVDLSFGCSNSLTDLTLTSQLVDATGEDLNVKVAFTNPSVTAENGSWVKYDGTGKKVSLGSGDLTISSLTFNTNTLKKQGSLQGVGGNPFIYYSKRTYASDGTYTTTWEYLGRCVTSSSRGTGNVMQAPFRIGGQVEGTVRGNSCVSGNKGTTATVGGSFSNDYFTSTDSSKLFFSNKALTLSSDRTQLRANNVLVASVENNEPVAAVITYNANGFKINANDMTVTLGPDSGLLAALADRAVQGIGGNPKIWLRAGAVPIVNGIPIEWTVEDNYLGRCNWLF